MHKECEKDNVETDICVNDVKESSYLIKISGELATCSDSLLGKNVRIAASLVYVIFHWSNL